MARLESNGLCGFWFPLSCDLGAFDRNPCDGTARILAEQFLMVPDKGALTWFAPSGPTHQQTNYLIAREILTGLSAHTGASVGAICLQSVRSLMLSDPSDLLRVREAQIYTFLGDPTIVMAWDYTTDSAVGIAHGGPLLTASPSPGTGQIVFKFADSFEGAARIDIYSVTGKTVKNLVTHIQRGGTVKWNRLDDQGRQVPSGIYYARVVAAGYEAATRFVLLK